MHAKDILYHMSCYKVFACRRQLDCLERNVLEKEDDTRDGPYFKAFEKLTFRMEEQLAADADSIWNMSDLCSKVTNLLEEEDICGTKYQSHLLKSRLLQHFRKKQAFNRQRRRNAAEYVFSSAVNAGPLIERCFELDIEA